jgi:hypothetical protein
VPVCADHGGNEDGYFGRRPNGDIDLEERFVRLLDPFDTRAIDGWRFD